ncbi:phosphate transporter [Radiomyces spectabilis]|uniref:phosphate transporter n=1 Tax=Radiomyces spectabilis TaxID=64574 RepID=UPI0022200322|nr:phosphate transporter [Radiomyces spectabilis]KAI8367708.1 phosphate transporter [Radiomyces spectabilis]
MMEIGDYTWIFAVAMVVAFCDAYGIGANDVANSFATSVSSGSLTLGQACIIACFTEFLGAIALGSNTADTIKGGILSVTRFVEMPEVLMTAMLCALCGSATWVIIATKNGWPVSTTHSIVGAVLGVGIAAFGGESINWGWSGISQIIASWFISPVIAGLVSAAIYLITKYAILRQVESVKWGLRLIPVYFFFTTAIEAFYIIYKGAPGTGASKMSIGAIIGISFGIASFFAAFAWFFFCPWLKRRVVDREDVRWYHVFYIHFVPKRPRIGEDKEQQAVAPVEIEEPNSANDDDMQTADGKKLSEKKLDDDVSASTNPETAEVPPVGIKARARHYGKRALDFALQGVRKDVRNLDSSHLKNVHAAAELYEDDVEYMFSFLQVLTACMASFAHGSNDVSNAVGPLSAIFGIWETAEVDVSGKVPVPVWILAYGGVAIDIGLATMGYRIMRSLGNNIIYFTPSRGFSAELGAALTVLTCSKLGLPVSTTHCITGATAAIGLCNGSVKAVNWRMLSWCFFSWILTLPFAGLTAGLLFAFANYSPSTLMVVTPS